MFWFMFFVALVSFKWWFIYGVFCWFGYLVILVIRVVVCLLVGFDCCSFYSAVGLELVVLFVGYCFVNSVDSYRFLCLIVLYCVIFLLWCDVGFDVVLSCLVLFWDAGFSLFLFISVTVSCGCFEFWLVVWFEWWFVCLYLLAWVWGCLSLALILDYLVCFGGLL